MWAYGCVWVRVGVCVCVCVLVCGFVCVCVCCIQILNKIGKFFNDKRSSLLLGNVYYTQ